VTTSSYLTLCHFSLRLRSRAAWIALLPLLTASITCAGGSITCPAGEYFGADANWAACCSSSTSFCRYGTMCNGAYEIVAQQGATANWSVWTSSSSSSQHSIRRNIALTGHVKQCHSASRLRHHDSHANTRRGRDRRPQLDPLHSQLFFLRMAADDLSQHLRA
jgi:hypothetical protein